MEAFKLDEEHPQAGMGVVGFSRICRICLMEGDLKLLESEDHLLNVFLTITKIDVCPTIKFPINLCKECMEKLEYISSFIEDLKCKNSMSRRDIQETNYSGTSSESAVEIKKELVDDNEEDTHTEKCRICSCSSTLTPLEDNSYLAQFLSNIQIKPDNFAHGCGICKTCTNKLEEILSFISSSLKNNNELGINKIFQTEANRCDFGLAGYCDIKIENDKNKVKIENDSDETEDVFGNDDAPEYVDVKRDILDGEQSCEDVPNLQIVTPYQCNSCGEIFPEKYLLQEHSLSHPEERPFECYLCKKRFVDKKNLRKHMYVHSQKRPFKCDVCDKSFPRKYHLERHKVTHTGEKSFQCHLCEKTFNRDTNLQQHYQIHIGHKPFRCTFCHRSFSLKHHMERHVLIHTGEKPYKCDYCDKSFSRKSYLQQHHLVHTGEKPYKCDYCDKQFALRHHVKQHMLTHTGEKSLKCDFCDRMFTLKVTLRRHLLVHGEEDPHECQLCGKSFIRAYLLQRHMRKHARKNELT